MSSLFVSYAVGDGDQRSGFGNLIIPSMNPPQNQEDIEELQRMIKFTDLSNKIIFADTIVVLGWAVMDG